MTTCDWECCRRDRRSRRRGRACPPSHDAQNTRSGGIDPTPPRPTLRALAPQQRRHGGMEHQAA
eukprot:618098-Rhodomonas_salina.1